MPASMDRVIRDLVRDELESQLRPFRATLSQLENSAREIVALRQLTDRLGPFLGALGIAPARRGPGRPPNPLKALAGGKRRGRPAGARNTVQSNRACAIIGCRKSSRSKGYCAAHYQKLRMLIRTNRRPSE